MWRFKHMKNSESEVLFKPQPMKGFERRRILYIPIDTPSGIIGKTLKKQSAKEKMTPFGQSYLLKNTAVIYLVVGAPSAVIWMERFIASGAREILILGFCGALEPDSAISDPILITEAVSEEGTSKHYFPHRESFLPSPGLNREMKKELRKRNLAHQTGTIVSTDAPFRETKSWLERHRKKGIRFVDMEASAVFAVAEYYGIEAAALMLVTDNLSKAKHKINVKHPRLIQNIKSCFFPFMK